MIIDYNANPGYLNTTYIPLHCSNQFLDVRNDCQRLLLLDYTTNPQNQISYRCLSTLCTLPFSRDPKPALLGDCRVAVMTVGISGCSLATCSGYDVLSGYSGLQRRHTSTTVFQSLQLSMIMQVYHAAAALRHWHHNDRPGQNEADAAAAWGHDTWAREMAPAECAACCQVPQLSAV